MLFTINFYCYTIQKDKLGIYMLCFSILFIIFYVTNIEIRNKEYTNGSNYIIYSKKNNYYVVEQNWQYFSLNYNGNLNVGDVIEIENIHVEKLTDEYSKYLNSNDVYYKIDFHDVRVVGKKFNLHQIVKSYFQNSPQYYKNYMTLFYLGNLDSETADIAKKIKSLGVYHLAVISGFHLNFFTICISKILTKLKINNSWQNIMIINLFIFIFIVSNYSIPIYRVVSVFIINIFIKKIWKSKMSVTSLLMSSLLYLIFRPGAINSISFQLSYLISFYILLFSKIKFKSKLLKLILIPVVANSVSLLVTTQINNLIYPFAILNNLLYTPIFGFIYLVSVLLFYIKPYVDFIFKVFDIHFGFVKLLTFNIENTNFSIMWFIVNFLILNIYLITKSDKKLFMETQQIKYKTTLFKILNY